jgi:hypothetical protein
MARGCPPRNGISSVPCRGRSLGRSAPSEPMKLPSEACIRREALAGSWAASGGPPSHPTSPFLRQVRPWHHGDSGACTRAHGGSVAPCAEKSSPDGCSANALDNQRAESQRWNGPRAAAGGRKVLSDDGEQLVSRRRLFGCSRPKSGSAESSWRPQLTQISAAPQTMAPR